jgi:peptidoglycan/xylan/chitin deacetylase (PgdA/CDA1 family)
MQLSDGATSSPRPISQWPTGEKLIALTYDDGPNPTITPRLLQLLQAKGARATFFLLGDSVKTYPHLVRTIVDSGMEVGNHSDTHPQFTRLSEEKIRSELQTNHQRIVAAAPNCAIRVMRPPYGAYNSAVLRVADQMGYKVILWSVDTNDWRKRTTEQMTQTVLNEARDGAIILMHDRYETSLQTTANVLDALSAQGYRFVTVSELLSRPRASASLVGH